MVMDGWTPQTDTIDAGRRENSGGVLSFWFRAMCESNWCNTVWTQKQQACGVSLNGR
jgi:hypothetical protein